MSYNYIKKEVKLNMNEKIGKKGEYFDSVNSKKKGQH